MRSPVLDAGAAAKLPGFVDAEGRPDRLRLYDAVNRYIAKQQKNPALPPLPVYKIGSSLRFHEDDLAVLLVRVR